MEKQEVKDIITEHLDEYATANQYGVSKIPYHIHNGTDSPLIPSSSLTFVDLFANGHQPSMTGSWEDWDLSLLVPVGAKISEVIMLNNDAVNGHSIGIRSTSSSANRVYTLIAKAKVTITTPIDSNRKVSIITGDVTPSQTFFFLTGYWI